MKFNQLKWGVRWLLLVAVTCSFDLLWQTPKVWLKTQPELAKPIDTYWVKSDLQGSSADFYFTDENCRADRQKFFACINGMMVLSERLGLNLSVRAQDLDLDSTSSALQTQRATEKLSLESWKVHFTSGAYQNFKFRKIWERLLALSQKSSFAKAHWASALNAYFSVAEDPHTYVVPLAFYDEVLSQSDSLQFPLGFVARRTQSGILIRKVFPNSPAGRAGLRRGDLVLKINNQLIGKMSSWKYLNLTRSLQAQRFLIEIERTQFVAKASQKVRIMSELFPGPIEYANVESRIIESDRKVGLITVHKFGAETCLKVRQALISLKEDSISGLMLDLRDNPGGQVNEAACVLNLFVPRGQILFETRYLDPRIPSEIYRSENERIYDGSLAVLINAGSASAAEIVAGSLKDLGRATLVGERSFGKGSFQDGIMWPGSLKVAQFKTRGFYYFPSGWTPQLTGIEPDLAAGPSEDSVLREADLYFEPLRPKDLWNGPQSLAWLTNSSCEPGATTADAASEDPQLETAEKLLTCRQAFQGL